MGIPALVGGHLPLGRWPATPDEVAATFVPPHATAKRQQIWADWNTLTDAVKSAVGQLPAAWLSGSYFTEKPEPGDIDCVYLIDTARLAQAPTNPRAASFCRWWQVARPGPPSACSWTHMCWDGIRAQDRVELS